MPGACPGVREEMCGLPGAVPGGEEARVRLLPQRFCGFCHAQKNSCLRWFGTRWTGCQGRAQGCERRGAECQGPCRGVRKPVYAYCRNDSNGLAMPKRHGCLERLRRCWEGCQGRAWRALPSSRATKIKTGPETTFVCRFRPGFLGLYSDVPCLCGDYLD